MGREVFPSVVIANKWSLVILCWTWGKVCSLEFVVTVIMTDLAVMLKAWGPSMLSPSLTWKRNPPERVPEWVKVTLPSLISFWVKDSTRRLSLFPLLMVKKPEFVAGTKILKMIWSSAVSSSFTARWEFVMTAEVDSQRVSPVLFTTWGLSSLTGRILMLKVISFESLSSREDLAWIENESKVVSEESCLYPIKLSFKVSTDNFLSLEVEGKREALLEASIKDPWRGSLLITNSSTNFL